MTIKEKNRKPAGYWDIYENCYEEALKYKTKTDFAKGSKGTYNSARKHGWIKDFFKAA